MPNEKVPVGVPNPNALGVGAPGFAPNVAPKALAPVAAEVMLVAGVDEAPNENVEGVADPFVPLDVPDENADFG